MANPLTHNTVAQPSHEEGVGLGLEDGTELPDGRTVAQHNEDVLHRKGRYLFWSRVGLVLMFLGFGLQLTALLIGAPAAARQGWALDYERYSGGQYAAEQLEAEQAQRG